MSKLPIYTLESDGPLALICYETISTLTAAVNQAHYPNAHAMIRSITSNVTQQQQLMQYAAACAQPGLQYFADCKANSMKEPLTCFKAARLFSPTKIEEMKPSTSEVDILAAFPFLSGGLNALKTELPSYLAAVEDISPDYNPFEFWKRHKETLPSWDAALCKSSTILGSFRVCFLFLNNPLANRRLDPSTTTLKHP